MDGFLYLQILYRKVVVLTDARVRHYDHNVRIGREHIDKRSKARISNFHTLEMSMEFTRKENQ